MEWPTLWNGAERRQLGIAPVMSGVGRDRAVRAKLLEGRKEGAVEDAAALPFGRQLHDLLKYFS
jgi:hypothetical protein